jgi:electron transport complex protein RnfC
VVTVTGNVDHPGNWEVALGTPASHLLELAGERAGGDGLIVGGPMMGFRAPAASIPVAKATNCLIASSPSLFPPPPAELPCIRCGACVTACPHELQPFEMYWWARAKNFGKAQEYKVFDCIECGCCAYVCPSRIPLVQYFRFAKSEIWARERDKAAAETAKNRFEFKQFREAREKEEKAERLAKAAAAQKAKAEALARQAAAEASGTGADGPAGGALAAKIEADAKKALIAAAMARAQTQKAAMSTAQAAASPAPDKTPAPDREDSA